MDNLPAMTKFLYNGPEVNLLAVTSLLLFGVIAIAYVANLKKPQPDHGDKKLHRRMSNMGYTTLATEIESNLSIPVSVMSIKGKLTKEQFAERLQQRMATDPFFIRYRSLVLGEQRTFVEIPDYNVNGNIHTHTLAKDETTISFVETLVNTPLDFSHPLWYACVIIDPNNEETTNVAWKIHHCIGDGASISMAMLKLSDQIDHFEEMVKKNAEASKANPKPKKALSQKLKELVGFFLLCLWSAYIITRKMALLVLRSEPRTMFKRPGGQKKRLSYQMMYSVTETKAVGKKYGATVNDVMLNCVAGAIRKTILATGEKVPANMLVRAGVPVDMRSSSEVIRSSSNKFSALMVDFPVGVEDSVKRLKLIKGGMNEAKNSLEKFFTYTLSQMLPLLPVFLMKQFVRFTASRITVAISNVRAASFHIGICGNPLEGFYGFVPPPPTVNLGVAVLSVGDDLGLNVLVDSSVGIDAKQFLTYAHEEFDALKEAAVAKEVAKEEKKEQ
ncbi:TPA: hypothetical protein N0F65_003278 [Lagenidium giganteum]|uniref:Diacylglycerol O-acyltransferase n=1 Tax=Lagenidium giganteum TaxID=4803 RepID=A0AAV2YX27_9STRA|nr:TPA: hypothetical protein N0F65_003278 [Lagenidium giganteum]